MLLGRVLAVLAGTAGVLLARPARAQIDLILTQTPNVFPAPTVADFDAGYVVNPTGIVFTVDTRGAVASRTTTVSIRSTSASLGGGKPLNHLEWRRADLPTWNVMTNANVVIESRPVLRNVLNDPWSNTVFFRIQLNWTSDPPAPHSANIRFTLTVTTP